MDENKATRESRRLLLAANDAAVLASLERPLSNEGFEVMTAADGQETLQIAGSLWGPDVILLDLELPGIDGVSVCGRVRSANESAIIVVLGRGCSDDEELLSLEAGADDYVTKPFAPDLLLARIRANLRGRPDVGRRHVLEFGDLRLDVRNYVARVKGAWVDLRPQEFRLLVALARAGGDPLSRKELTRRAGTQWRGASSRTVDMNISRIRARIETPSDYTYIHSVRGFGYRFEPVPKEPPASRRTSLSERTV